jgi:hypothetical protein
VRRYQKIQDVLAIVGGFLRVCQTVFKIIIVPLTKYYRSEQLVNGAIHWREEPEGEIPNPSYSKITQDSKAKQQLRDITKKIYSFSHEHEGNKSLEGLDNSQHFLIGDKKVNNVSAINQSHIKLDQHVEMQQINFSKSVKDKLNLRKFSQTLIQEIETGKRSKFTFSLTKSQFLARTICKGRAKRDPQIKMFDIAEEYVKERMDVFGYLNVINEVNKLKAIMLSHPQHSALNFTENPTFYPNNPDLNINNVEYMRALVPSRIVPSRNEMNFVTDYFSKKIYLRQLDQTDKILIMNLNEDVLKELNKKLAMVLQNLNEEEQVVFEKNKNDYDVEMTKLFDF